MIQWSLLLAGLLCFTPIAQSESVYKCVAPEGVTYQQSPCDGGATSSLTAITAANPVASTPRTAEMPRCIARLMPSRLPWRPRSLCLGITDDEVLNLAGWGRPSNIARLRSARGWQEQWTYVSRTAGSRRLEFLNGKLESVETPGADQHDAMRVPVASLTRVD